MTALFRRLVKRLNRDRAKRRPRDPAPLIYVANLARAKGATGYHVHLLLWDYVHAPTLIGHCKDLGLGLPQLAQLPADAAGNIDYWQQVMYVPAQHEPIFGSDKHERHEDRVKSARRLLYPQKRTLARHCPELLSALEDANDPAVPDETLLARLPRFSSRNVEKGKGGDALENAASRGESTSRRPQPSVRERPVNHRR
jgi:hypothetical protein